MLIYSVITEGVFITFTDTKKNSKISFNSTGIRTVLSDSSSDYLTLVIVGGNTHSYKYSEVEDPNNLGNGFPTLVSLRQYIVNGIIYGTTTDVFFSIGQAASDTTTDMAVLVGSAISYAPFNMEITEIFIGTGVAPLGSALVVDVNINGLSILSTKVSIDAGETTSLTASTPPVISNTTLIKGDKISIDIDQVGATTPGTALTVYIQGILT